MCGGGGVGGGGDAVEFAGVAAGEFAADDVGVFGEGIDSVGVQVEAGNGAGVVVDEDGEGGGGGDVGEEVVEGGGREEGLVVGGREHDAVVAAAEEGLVAELDGLASRLGAAADDYGERVVAGVVEGFACDAGYELSFVVGQVDGLAVGALCSKPGDACVCESDRMLGDSFEV